jgi:hypothetical protein
MLSSFVVDTRPRCVAITNAVCRGARRAARGAQPTLAPLLTSPRSKLAAVSSSSVVGSELRALALGRARITERRPSPL